MNTQQQFAVQFLLVLFAFSCFLGLVTGLLAMRKGFGFMPWFLTGGIIIVAAIALGFLPSAKDPKLTETEKQELISKGNGRGWIISAIVAVGWVIQFLRVVG